MPRSESHPVGGVARRVAPYLGLEVVDHGYLTESYGGHPVGTAYVDITAACGMDREKARRILGTASGLPELAWECGWRVHMMPNGQRVTLLRMFPKSSTATATK